MVFERMVISAVTEAVHREQEDGPARVAEWLGQVPMLLQAFDEAMFDGEDADSEDEVFFDASETVDVVGRGVERIEQPTTGRRRFSV